jgi:transglutaminase-like putative cysteine protease
MTNGSLRMPLAAAFATITAAICLGPIFLTGGWFLPSAFAVLVVAAGCEVARRMAASRATVPVGGAVALLAFLLLRYAHAQALYGLLPWTDSVDHLGDLVSSGRSDIRTYQSPVGVSPGIELLTVGGVGLVALAVDTLAVTWRRAALAGLPLLVLYTVPTSIAPDGVSWVAFALCGVAYLTLLLAESRERVSRWGRPMRYTAERTNYRPEVETAPLGQVGRRVGATALGLALIVPAVLPDVTASSFGFGAGGFGHGGGDGPKVTVFNPILELGASLRQGEDTPLIRYRGRSTYLRLVADDTFNGDTWAPSDLKVSRDDNDVEDGLANAPGLSSAVGRVKRTHDVEVFDLDQKWLPLPYPTTKVRDIDGTWLYDPSTFNVFGENSSTRQISYTASSLEVSPDAAQLAAAAPSIAPSLRRYVELPDDVDPFIVAQANDVVGDAKATTNYARAMALQNWLRGPEFTYSKELATNPAGDKNGTQAIVAFLQSKRGYCVQFASTMAVMARILHIPARVAIGFAPGEKQANGSYVVGAHDAHAWPELYFQGVGWVRFEPTPGSGAPSGVAPPSYAKVQPGDGTPTDGTTAAPTPTGAAAGGPGGTDVGPRIREDVLDEQQPGGGIGAGPVRIPVVPFVVGIVVLVLLAVPAFTRVLLRRRRWADTSSPTAVALAAWTDLQDTLVDHGYDWDPADPPRRGAARLVERRHLAGEPAQAVQRIAAATERARYAPEMTPVGDLRTDVDAVRRQLAEDASRWGRWRARLLPRSTRTVAVGISEKLADVLDGFDAAFAAVGTRLRLRRT